MNEGVCECPKCQGICLACEVERAPLLDTGGRGDSWLAGYLSGFLNGLQAGARPREDGALKLEVSLCSEHRAFANAFVQRAAKKLDFTVVEHLGMPAVN